MDANTTGPEPGNSSSIAPRLAKEYRTEALVELVRVATRLTIQWPLAFLTLIATIILSVGLPTKSPPGFPESIGAAATALLTAEVFILGFALNAWQADQRRLVDLVVNHHARLVNSFCMAGPNRKQLHFLATEIDILRAERDMVVAVLHQKSFASLQDTRDGFQFAQLAHSGRGAAGQDARQVLFLIEGDRSSKDRRASKKRDAATLRDLRLVAEGRFMVGFWLATGVMILCIVGGGYGGWWSGGAADHSVWRAISLSAAAVGIYLASEGVRYTQRRIARRDLEDNRLPLLVHCALLQEIPSAVPSHDEFTAIENFNQSLLDGLAVSINDSETAAQDRRRHIDIYIDLKRTGSPLNNWWPHDGVDRALQVSPLEATSAPIALRTAAFHLWLALAFPSDEFSNDQLTIAANFLSPFIRPGGVDSLGWTTDIPDPVFGFLRATIASHLGDKIGAAQLIELATRWTESIKGTPAHLEIQKLMKPWMLPAATNDA